MREMGLVNFEDKKGSVAHVSVIDDDKYKRDDPLIETIVEELEDFCDELGCDKFEVDVRFFEWVRSLAFLEESNGKTEKKDSVFFSLFVENVKKRSEFKYSRLKDVMCGCLMAEAIETLSYKQDDGKFKGVDFYFDAPMLLDMFDLNSRDSTAYVREIVDSIKKFGGRVSTFEHCVVEAEKVLTAVLYAYRDNPALVSFDIGLRIKENSAHVSRVVSISGNLRKMLVDAGIFIVDAEARESQDKFFLPFSQSKEDEMFNDIGHQHSGVDGRINDAKSIATVFRLRGFLSPKKMAQAKAIFVTKNAQIAKVSTRWQKHTLKNDSSCISATFYDATLAAYLWTHFGFDLDKMASRKLLSSCATLLAPGSQMMDTLRTIIYDGEEYAEDYLRLVTDREHAGYLTFYSSSEEPLTVDQLKSSLSRRIQDIRKGAIDEFKRQEARKKRFDILARAKSHRQRSKAYGVVAASLVFLALSVPSALGAIVVGGSSSWFVFLVLLCAGVTPFINTMWLGHKVSTLCICHLVKALGLIHTYKASRKSLVTVR